MKKTYKAFLISCICPEGYWTDFHQIRVCPRGYNLLLLGLYVRLTDVDSARYENVQKVIFSSAG